MGEGREGEFTYIDMEEIEAIADELEAGEGYHAIAHDMELLPHKECISCWCGPVLVYRDERKVEIWAHKRTEDHPQ